MDSVLPPPAVGQDVPLVLLGSSRRDRRERRHLTLFMHVLAKRSPARMALLNGFCTEPGSGRHR